MVDIAELRRILLEVQTEVRNGNTAVSRLLDAALAELEKGQAAPGGAQGALPGFAQAEPCDHVFVAQARPGGIFRIQAESYGVCAKCGYRLAQSLPG